MEQLTLEQAAIAHAKMCYPGKGAYYSADKDGFIAGAEWQKQQYKNIITEINSTYDLLMSLYQKIQFGTGINWEELQQSLRDRMAKQLEILNSTF